MDLTKPRNPAPEPASIRIDDAGFASTLSTEPEHKPRKLQKLWHLWGSLVLGFLGYYTLASYTSFTASTLNPGQVIFSNSLIKLWTACYTLAFIVANALLLLRLFWPELFRFFRPDVSDGPDLATSFRSLPVIHQIWLFVVVFFLLCYLFLGLLAVSLPESVSVGP